MDMLRGQWIALGKLCDGRFSVGRMHTSAESHGSERAGGQHNGRPSDESAWRLTERLAMVCFHRRHHTAGSGTPAGAKRAMH
jgi:hypothetical protein